MCFTPWISLTTFAIEFILAFLFLFRNPKDKINQIIALLSVMLGIYQLNEFFICSFNYAIFTHLALATTALLPAIGISFALILSKKSVKWHPLIYIPSIFFAVSLFFTDKATCMKYFVQYPPWGLLGRFYGFYYLIYIVAAIAIMYLNSNIKERRLLQIGMVGMFLFTIPTFIFIIILPQFKVQFPSVLCHFALLLAIDLIVLLWYKEKAFK